MNNPNPLLGFNQVIDLRQADAATVKAVQTQLNRIGYSLAVDGLVGEKTLNAFKAFKTSANLAQETILGATTVKKLLEAPNASKFLTNDDYVKAANFLQTNVAAIKAVLAVEAAGKGFFSDGRPKILFEAHWFDQFTKGRFRSSHPALSSAHWNRNLYVGGVGEYARLNKALALDRIAAYKSASWGLGQVMGFNHNLCGYSDVISFVEAMHVSEGKQLLAMCGFIKSQGLADDLRSRNWEGFARGYNGAGYRQNNYHNKLASAYNSFA